MDKFEKFFRENRTRLDTEDLDDAGWERIACAFHKPKSNRKHLWLYVAAGIAVIMIAGIFFYQNAQIVNPLVSNQRLLSDSLPQMAREESSYIKLIDQAEIMLKDQTVPEKYHAMFDDFSKQLAIIDKQYSLYKKEIEENGYSEELIQQVIYNYQLKLSVLQMWQSEIKKINELSNVKNDEPKKKTLSL